MARAYRSNNKNQESLAGIALIGLAYAVILSAVAVKPPTLGGGYKATHTL